MSEHKIRRTLSPCTWGTQVCLICSCGRWSAMTVSYGPYSVASCIRSLLSSGDKAHTMDALVR